MKRVISLIVALSLVFTVGAGVSFSAGGQTGYADVDGTGYETPVGILGALGIMTGYADGSFHPYSTITRAEMASLAVRLHGLSDYGKEVSLEEVQYLDMDGHPYAADVAYARSLGIIDGNGDGYFYPDDPATYEQAVKMIIGALGYDYYANALGEYPAGYLRVAQELKLTSGIGLTVGSYITRGDAAKIAYRALTVDLMVASNFNDNGEITYEITEGQNALNTYFDVEEIRGVVEETSYTSLNGDTTLDEGEVRIGDEIFDEGDTNISDYIGYYVTFYALTTEYNYRRVIISYKVESNKSSYIKLNAEDIADVSLSSTRYTIEYWRNATDKDPKKVYVSLTPTVIYNGVALTDFSLSDFDPLYGQLTLVDNNRDGEYDLVDILSYDVMVVQSASSASGNVNAYAAFNTGLRAVKLKEDDEDYTVRLIDGEGKRVSFSSITVNTVLNVAVSKNNGSTVRTAIVSNDKVNGTIESVLSDGSYMINGSRYDVVSYLKNNEDMKSGVNGVFYLTYDGRIAGYDVEQKTAGKNFGMILGFKKGKMSDGGNQVKMLKADGTIAVVNLAGTVTVNGTPYDGEELFARMVSEESPLFGRRQPESGRLHTTVPEPQYSGVIYKLDGNGKLSDITMWTEDTVIRPTTDKGYSDKEIRCVVQRGKNSGVTPSNWYFNAGNKKTPASTGPEDEQTDSLYYSPQYHCFHRSDNKIYVPDNMPLFKSQKTKTNSDAQAYTVIQPSQIASWDEGNLYWFEIYFYYLGDSDEPSFAVCFDGVDADGQTNGSSSVNTAPDRDWSCINDNIRIVDRVVETYDNEGNIGYSLLYWEGSSTGRADFHEDYLDAVYRGADPLDPNERIMWRRGDMIRFVRYQNKIVYVNSIFTDSYWGGPGSGRTGQEWNDPTGDELYGEKNPDHVYKFPYGFSRLNQYGGEYRQLYYLGRVSSIDNLKYLSTMDIQYDANTYLEDEPIEGSCYRLEYDNRGYIVGVEDVGVGALAENQLVLVRKQGSRENYISTRIRESYILYEYEEIAESDELREEYKDIYTFEDEEDAYALGSWDDTIPE